MANKKDIATYHLESDLKQIGAWIKDLRDRQIIALEKGFTKDGEPLVNMPITKNGTTATPKQILKIIEDWARDLANHAAAAQKQVTII